MFKKALVLYPFLFALFPVLYLYAYNIDEVSGIDLLLPTVVFLICTAIPFFLLRLIVKDYKKSAIITTYFLILFFTYGYAREFASGIKIGGTSLSNFYFLAPIWVILFVIGFLLIRRMHRMILPLTKILNIVVVILISFSLINISIYEIKYVGYGEENTGTNIPVLTSPDKLPDIYYVILDGYARSDTLSSIFNYDNSEFYDYLTGKGFYIASQSRCNYAQTILSIVSCLNMEYLNYLSDTEDIEGKDYTKLYPMVENNKVKELFKSEGYRFLYVASNPWNFKRFKTYNPTYHLISLPGMKFSSFANYLLQTTALVPLCPYFIGSYDRNSILEALAIVSDIPDIRGPTFVFAHIRIPHPPYVFDRDGNVVKQEILEEQGKPWADQEGYVEQLIFTNKKVRELIDGILSKSDIQPIIILQADHGSSSTISDMEWKRPFSEFSRSQLGERMNILNAYLLPQNGYQLYDSITPVNSFRVIFNGYFGADMEILKDESYFSSYDTPYKLFRVP